MSATAASPVDFRSTMIVPPLYLHSPTLRPCGVDRNLVPSNPHVSHRRSLGAIAVKAAARAIGMVANELRSSMTMLSAYVVLTISIEPDQATMSNNTPVVPHATRRPYRPLESGLDPLHHSYAY